MRTRATRFWIRLCADSMAVTAIEYSLIAALIALVIIVSVTSLGSNASATFHTIATKL